MNAKLNLIENEHLELLESIRYASKEATEAGNLYSQILSLFEKHMDKERKTVFPLLGYLSDRLLSKSMIDKSKLIEARDAFENEYEHMLEEHLAISSLLQKVIENGIRRKATDSVELAEKLLHHVELEEEMLYPAAFASGDLIEWERELLGARIKY